MVDYLSSYTGQEIDEKLGQVEEKVNIADIVDVSTQGEATTPASSRLMKEAYAAIDTINTFLGQKVLRIDTGTQTVNGAKTFAALLTMSRGGTIPANYFLNLTTKATTDLHAVNLATLKDHGLNIDDSYGAGLKLERLATGYLKILLDIASMTEAPANQAVSYIPVNTVNGDMKMSWNTLVTAIAGDGVVTGKVDKVVYDAKMTQIDSALAARVLISTYNADLASTNTALNARVLTTTHTNDIQTLNTSIGLRVLQTTYDTKMTAIDTAIGLRVLQTDYNVKMTALDTAIAAKVNTTDFNAFVASANTALAGKADKPVEGSVTVAASGSSTVFSGTPSAAAHILAIAYLSDNLYDVYDIFISNTSVISATLKVRNSTGTDAPATFSATMSGGILTLSVANASTTSAMTVKFKVLSTL